MTSCSFSTPSARSARDSMLLAMKDARLHPNVHVEAKHADVIIRIAATDAERLARLISEASER